MTPPRQLLLARRVDTAALAVVVLAIGWTLVAGRDAARPWPTVGAWVLAAVGVIAGRLLARRHRALPTTVVAVAVGGAALLALPDLGDTQGGPLGYANANATLFGLGAVAAVATATRIPRRNDRGAALTVAVALVGTTALTRSAAATAILVGVLVVVAALRSLRRLDLVVPAGLVACSVALGVTVAIGVNAEPSARDRARVELWSHAAALIDANPADGVGPGNFQGSSPRSRDPDTRHAHHDYLEYAAEQGGVGLVLLLTAIALAYGMVWVAYDATTRTALGAAAVTLLALHATVDYVLHVPQLVAVTAVLLGATTARRRTRRLQPIAFKPEVSPVVRALARSSPRGRRGRGSRG